MENDQNSPLILIVDDQEGVRLLISKMLKRMGYDTLDVPDGPHALELAAATTSISLAIIDITMPEMDGITLTKRIRELQPDLPVVLMSGFDINDVLTSRPRIDPAPIHLEKPFKMDQLGAAIDAAKSSNLNP